MKKLLNKLGAVKASTYMLILFLFYSAGSLIINLMAVKTLGYYDTIDYATHWGNAIIPVTTAGTCLSWLVFAAIDIIAEVYGKKTTVKTFWIVAIINLILTVAAALIVFIPGNPWTKDAYDGVFGGNWGITLASIIAFLIGNYVNAIIMVIMKSRSEDKGSVKAFTFRVIVSTLVGQFLDNAIFYIVALAPGFGLGGFVNEAVRCATWGNLFTIVGFTTGIELVVEVLFAPLFHKFAQFLIKKNEAEGFTLE